MIELNNLSEKEKKEVLKILHQLSSGDNSSYNALLQEDYNEIPVDIETFLRDKKYLGKGVTSEEGKFMVFPFWVKTLKEIFPDPLQPAVYNTVALTGGIGLGKSFIAVVILLYELYRMLCLKNPYTYYGVMESDLITFAVMNTTLDASRGVAWDKLQQLLQSSEWFMNHGTVSGRDYQEWRPPAGIELIAGSRVNHVRGKAIFCAFLDEISFQPNMDVEIQKAKAKELVSEVVNRMQSRFMKGEHNPTILTIASSKRTEQSFMEVFIQQRKALDSKSTLIIDEPQWVIRTDKDSPRKFKVAIGNKFLTSEVIPLDVTEQDLKLYRDKGFNILDVPMGYYEQFVEDTDKALQDIAGISTTNSSRYISGVRLKEVKNEELKNPFEQDIIEVGNAQDDTHQYYDFFNLDNIPQGMKEKPLYIHLDMSISGDKTGIAGVWIKGSRPHKENEPESHDGLFQLAFSVSIKAPKGHQVSFEKNRQFIYWLKEQGFNIKGVSSDTFQSYDLLQAVQSRGFNTEIISVDRLTDRVCLPYQFFKNVIYEKRIEIYDSTLLTEEIIGLERNNNSGKVDHSPSGINSKDSADAVCGALWNASKHVEEFNFEFGETLDTIISVSTTHNAEYEKQQVILNFEDELKRAKINDDYFLDFGMGKRGDVNIDGYLMNGIII